MSLAIVWMCDGCLSFASRGKSEHDIVKLIFVASQ